MSRQYVPELEDLIGKCVVVRYLNGESITGFLEDVVAQMITLFVAGKPVFVPLFNVTQITKAEDRAC